MPVVDWDDPAFFEQIHRIYSDADNIPPALRMAMDAAAEKGEALPSVFDVPSMLSHDRDLASLDPTADAHTLIWTIMRDRYGWSQPAAETIACIEKHARGRTILEIGAGSGYWSAVLAARGNHVVAIDNRSWKQTDWTASWGTVLTMDAYDAVVAYPGVAILLVFPVIGVGMKVLCNMRPGQILMTVAPRHCTGDTQFFTTRNRDFDRIDDAPTLSIEGALNADFEVFITRDEPRKERTYEIVQPLFPGSRRWTAR